MYVPPRHLQNWYILIYLAIKHYYHQIQLLLSRVALETPQTILNNPISHKFICLLSDMISFTKVLSHHYADDAKLQMHATGTIFIVETWNFQTLFQTP